MPESSGDKTEKATPKKRRDAKKDGQVRKSTEVNTALCCVAIFALLQLWWPTLTENLGNTYTKYLSEGYLVAAAKDVNTPVILEAFKRAILDLALTVLPVMAVALVVGVAANVAQVGFMFTSKPLMPKFSKLNPIKGFKNLFSITKLVDLIKSFIKIVLFGYIVYTEYKKLLIVFPTMMLYDVKSTYLDIMDTVFAICLKMSLVLCLIAGADFLFQWWKFEKDLKMTKQEIKDEYKMMEGDPQIKGKIRQKQRQMSAMRMMEKVPSADVVITNPTHYAVALKYEDGSSGAPRVVAKGADFTARRIKDIARENGVEIVENKPLAQALFKICEVDDEIPEQFYQAVADILVFIYRKKNGRPAGRAQPEGRAL